MTDNNEYGFVPFFGEGKMWLHTDKSRLQALPLYKRLFAKICKRYRNRYIDLKPFKCKIEKYEKSKN